MMNKYYNFQSILKFIGLDYEFERKDSQYPFNKGKENIQFSWGQIIIPKYGIRQVVLNKLKGIKDLPIDNINMMYQIPYVIDSKVGIINKNIKISFRYDKEYKYGNITKSIYECCFWILENATPTNDFYVIKDDCVQEFFSRCIINNQWGLGTLCIEASPNEGIKN